MTVNNPTYNDKTLQYCYDMGVSAIKEKTTENCHFTLFSSQEKTNAWMEGFKSGR